MQLPGQAVRLQGQLEEPTSQRALEVEARTGLLGARRGEGQ